MNAVIQCMDGMGNSLNHKMEEMEEIKKMDGWTDRKRYTGRQADG